MLARTTIIAAAFAAAFFLNASRADAAMSRVMPIFIGRTILLPTPLKSSPAADATYALTGEERPVVRKPKMRMLSFGSKAVWIAR